MEPTYHVVVFEDCYGITRSTNKKSIFDGTKSECREFVKNLLK